VRDLLGITSRPADNFPADGGGGGGFDNNADTLYIPPILMERYLDAATKILTEAKPERLFIVRPSAKHSEVSAAKQILEYQAFRAYRRPVTPEEITKLLRLYHIGRKQGESWEGGVKLAMKAVLVSPHFLFRIERERKTDSPYKLNDFELASRLSYFLWASMPDETLLQLAKQGKLQDPKVLEQQVERMPKCDGERNGAFLRERPPKRGIVAHTGRCRLHVSERRTGKALWNSGSDRARDAPCSIDR
jgi:hypothetical protein